jgi:hypothetical protein
MAMAGVYQEIDEGMDKNDKKDGQETSWGMRRPTFPPVAGANRSDEWRTSNHVCLARDKQVAKQARRALIQLARLTL